MNERLDDDNGPLTAPVPPCGRRLGRGLLGGGALALLAATALLSGCNAKKTPTGQVIAVVNGQDITSQDLVVEARASGMQGSQFGPELLQRVIARELLAQAAHSQKLDQTPTFPSERRRLEQTLLAQRLAQTVVPPQDRPSDADVARFMASHPYVFSRREKLKMDQLRFTSSVNLPETGMESLFAISTRLKNMGIPFDRGEQTVDTGTLPPGYAERLLAIPSGKPFLMHQGAATVVNVITGAERVELPQDQQAALASRALQQQRVSQLVDNEVNHLRAGAKISYQPGYAPKPAPKKPATAAAS